MALNAPSIRPEATWSSRPRAFTISPTSAAAVPSKDTGVVSRGMREKGRSPTGASTLPFPEKRAASPASASTDTAVRPSPLVSTNRASAGGVSTPPPDSRAPDRAHSKSTRVASQVPPRARRPVAIPPVAGIPASRAASRGIPFHTISAVGPAATADTDTEAVPSPREKTLRRLPPPASLCRATGSDARRRTSPMSRVQVSRVRLSSARESRPSVFMSRGMSSPPFPATAPFAAQVTRAPSAAPRRPASRVSARTPLRRSPRARTDPRTGAPESPPS